VSQNIEAGSSAGCAASGLAVSARAGEVKTIDTNAAVAVDFNIDKGLLEVPSKEAIPDPMALGVRCGRTVVELSWVWVALRRG